MRWEFAHGLVIMLKVPVVGTHATLLLFFYPTESSCQLVLSTHHTHTLHLLSPPRVSGSFSAHLFGIACQHLDRHALHTHRCTFLTLNKANLDAIIDVANGKYDEIAQLLKNIQWGSLQKVTISPTACATKPESKRYIWMADTIRTYIWMDDTVLAHIWMAAWLLYVYVYVCIYVYCVVLYSNVQWLRKHAFVCVYVCMCVNTCLIINLHVWEIFGFVFQQTCSTQDHISWQ